MSDGGEGFASILTDALGGDRVPVRVTGPLGTPVEAFFGRAGDCAVIEAASACGLALVPPAQRNPLLATSRGVGELICAAWRSGCRRILVGLGGSATCDGGEGMMAVEGIRDLRGRVRVEAFCDVDNPLTGPAGAARVFAPQKGAGPAEVEQLEERLLDLSERMRKDTGKDIAALPGAGAAGGLGAALAACFDAALVPGVEAVLDALDFRRRARGADWIITGEGRSDAQTLHGKVPVGLLRHAEGIPVALLSGRIQDREMLLGAGFARVIEVSPAAQPLSEALRPEVAEKNLRAAVRAFAETL